MRNYEINFVQQKAHLVTTPRLGKGRPGGEN